MTATRGKILPFYLVIDVSFSMDGAKLASANQVVPRVKDALAMNPILSDKVRFSLLDFSDEANVVLPLCDLLEVPIPTLICRGGTNYSAALRLLRQEIEKDVRQLKNDGFQVHRPAVFFLSDGMPTDEPDEWLAAFGDLTTGDFKQYPNFVPCGVDQADARTLQQLIHPKTGRKPMRMYLMDKNEQPADAIGKIAEILISSVLSSSRSMAEGDSGIILAESEDVPEGIHSYSAEDFV
jgi:uncharacterized protein YegL